MNNRPTPETDAFAIKFKSVCGSKAWVPTDICRRFERDRDEAIDRLREWSSWCVQYRTERDEAREKAERYRIEANAMMMQRDEAREVNSKLRDIAERAINYLDQSYRDGYSDEVSDLRNELEQLKEGAK